MLNHTISPDCLFGRRATWRTNREKYAFCGVWGDATKQASAEPTLKVPGFTLPSTVHELLSKLLVTS